MSWMLTKHRMTAVHINHGLQPEAQDWEKHCQKAVTAVGFTKVTGWECLYKHEKWGLFLSIYVDDFKMGGGESQY